MKDGKSLVRTGDNRYHSIFMTDGDALFTNPSSLATPLIALGATATIVGRDPVSDLAVIKIGLNNLDPISWGNSSSLKLGQ